MGWEAWAALAVIVLIFYALARNLAGQDVILLGGAVTLTTLSVFSDRFPSPTDLAAGFGNEGVLTVAFLFVVAAGLSETGAMNLVTEPFLGRPRSLVDAQWRLMLPVAGISAFLNNTPVVAMFVPVVHDWCKKANLSPSKLFIPLSYAAVLGGVCTLIGTSTNLVVHSLMLQARRTDPSMPIFGLFTIGAVGLPVTIAGLIYIVVFSRRLLPERTAFRVNVSDPRQYTVEMMVQPGSAIDGQTIEGAGLRHLPGMYLAALERDGELLVAIGPDQRLRGGDRLQFVGIVESVVDLGRVRGLVPATDQVMKVSAPRHSRCLVEAVVSDTCPVVGRSIREGRFRSRYDAAVIAVHRNGERIDKKIGDIVLRPGDTLLLETHPRFLRNHRYNRDFLLISAVEDSQPKRHERAWIALLILAGVVTVATTEDFTGIGIFHASLLGAGAMGLFRCLSAEQARRSLDLSVIVSIAAALGIGRAMQSTGLADAVAGQLIAAVQGLGPWGVLGGIYFLTLIFTELITNNAAAALAFPLGYSAATSLGVNFMPFAIAIAIAASAGFATPLGYQTHMMVYGPGGYRFSDYVRFGVPLDLLVMAITVALTPLIFPFR